MTARGKTEFPNTSRDTGYASESGKSHSPLMSIVTPCLNRAHMIEDVIKSGLIQDYPKTEHIIVDGGSTDGTTDIIEKYADEIAHWECQ